MKNKKIMIIVMAAILLLTGFIVYKVIDEVQTEKRIAEREAEQQEAVMLVVMPLAEKYGFDDIVCNKVEFPSVDDVRAVMTSAKFEAAEDIEKLQFLSDVSYYAEQKQQNNENYWVSQISKNGLSIRVISGASSYVETIEVEDCGVYSALRRSSASDAYNWGMVNPYKETVLYMETINSEYVGGKLAKRVDDSGEECYWCKGTGSVKYYYGESDLEAFVDGHDASWYGTCGSCGGTGKTK